MIIKQPETGAEHRFGILVIQLAIAPHVALFTAFYQVIVIEVGRELQKGSCLIQRHEGFPHVASAGIK